jgi:hypothetical protein
MVERHKDREEFRIVLPVQLGCIRLYAMQMDPDETIDV